MKKKADVSRTQGGLKSIGFFSESSLGKDHFLSKKIFIKKISKGLLGLEFKPNSKINS